MSKWTIPLDRLAKKQKTTLDRVTRQATFQLFDEVQKRSPVGNPDLWKSPAPPGYVGGRFRGNWQTTQGNPAEGTLDVVDPGGALARSEALKALEIPAGGIVYFTNNLPYARRLEYEGWSTQAPAGMVRLSVNEFARAVKALVR